MSDVTLGSAILELNAACASLTNATMTTLERVSRLQEENEFLWRRIKDREARIALMQPYAPPIRICKTCGRYYSAGYLCACGRDNSMPQEGRET